MEHVCGTDVSYEKNTANRSRLLNNEEAVMAGYKGSEHGVFSQLNHIFGC